jgi:hypothetical protein
MDTDRETDTVARGRDAENYTDNQGALQTLVNPRQSSGQYLVVEIISEWEIWKARNKGRALELYWIPAHTGVQTRKRRKSRGGRQACQLEPMKMAASGLQWRHDCPPAPRPIAG